MKPTRKQSVEQNEGFISISFIDQTNEFYQIKTLSNE